MAREKDGYRDILERIYQVTGGAVMVTVDQASQVTGYSKKYVTQVYKGSWVGNARGKRIPATELARKICG